jgi:PmbA protein
MLLDRRAVGRVLGVLLGPMSGGALHQGRSCLQDKLGESLGPETLSIYDDPTLVRGSRSRHFDGDGFPSVRRSVLENGRLSMYFLGQYYARKLDLEPTTAGASNLFIPQGGRSTADILGSLDTCIRVDSFLGGNSNSSNGDFSFGVRGMRFEKGEAVQPVSEMNISGNLFTLLPRFHEAANDTWQYSSVVSPSLLFNDIQFSGL